MSLNSTAQMMENLVVEEQPMVFDPSESGEHVVVYPEHPSSEMVLEMHDPEMMESTPALELSEHPHDLEIMVGELPGVAGLDPEMEQKLEVHEDVDSEKADDSDSKSKVPTKWDWQSKGAHGFLAWVKERCDDVPKHSGYDTAGIERAISYMQKLDAEISKAMRLDLDSELDADKIEQVRSTIDNGIESLHARHEKISKKNKKKKKAMQDSDGLVKEAQKIPGIAGIVVTVPLLISGIVRLCINGSVSAGHDIEDMFNRMAKKRNLSDREIFECMQLFADMGYPMRRDRGFDPDEDVDPTSSDNFDWAANYQA